MTGSRSLKKGDNMRDVEIIGMLKTYVAKSLVGAGALKGAPCKIKSIVKASGINTVTFEWTDDNGDTQESTMLVADGAKGDDGDQGIQGIQGPPGADGTDGVSPTITVKTSSSSEYVLTITDKNGSYDTPNLKGSGGGSGASALSDLTDIDLENLANGQVLVYNSVTAKWENVSLTIPANLDDLTDVIITTAASGQFLKWNGAAWVNAAIDYGDITNTPTIPTVPVKEVQVNGTALTPDGSGAVNVQAITSASVNGVAQTITSGAVDLDVASNLITEDQWTSIGSILS